MCEQPLGGGLFNNSSGVATLKSPITGNTVTPGPDGEGIFNNFGGVTLIASPVTSDTPTSAHHPAR
jgi:hypothetical protein